MWMYFLLFSDLAGYSTVSEYWDTIRPLLCYFGIILFVIKKNSLISYSQIFLVYVIFISMTLFDLELIAVCYAIIQQERANLTTAHWHVGFSQIMISLKMG